MEKQTKQTKKEKILDKIVENYSEKELELLANNSTLVKHKNKTKDINFDGEHLKIGFITDTHIGSVFFEEKWFESALREFEKSKVNFVCHSGDLSEGMSNRPSQVYELTHTGYNAQKEYCIQLLDKIHVPVYIIDGNHDRWHIKNSGALLVKDVADKLEHVNFLGHDEGDLKVNGIKIKLWHGEDSSSYATSYRCQKLIEVFTGGEKPNLLLCGHTHKMVYLFDRNIHCFSGGAMCRQSSWMRSKRLANHSGFWIIDLVINKKSIVSCSGRFHSLYS